MTSLVSKIGKRSRSSNQCHQRQNSACSYPVDYSGNAIELDGSPWQALKRLRVADIEDDVSRANAVNNFPAGAQTTFQTALSSYESDHFQTHGSGLTLDQRFNQSSRTRSNTYQDQDFYVPGTERYATVNHVLGSLHQERIKREELYSRRLSESNNSNPTSDLKNYSIHGSILHLSAAGSAPVPELTSLSRNQNHVFSSSTSTRQQTEQVHGWPNGEHNLYCWHNQQTHKQNSINCVQEDIQCKQEQRKNYFQEDRVLPQYSTQHRVNQTEMTCQTKTHETLPRRQKMVRLFTDSKLA